MGGSVRTLGPDAAQVEYRLTAQSGCDMEVAPTQADNDDQLQHRLSSGERPLEWVGRGLNEFGIAAGTQLTTVEDLDRIRAIMDGRDPNTDARLIDPKMAVHPDAKLRAQDLVDAVHRVAEAAHTDPDQLLDSPTLAERFERLRRGVAREGEAHYAPLADMAPIAEAAGISPSLIWGRQDVERAQTNAHRRVRTGNRGYDLVIDLPKSWSVLAALGDPALSDLVEETFLESVRETVTAVEGWVAYGMTGHHGDGQNGQPIDTSGLLGTVTLHRTARGVGGEVGDPHMHAHIMLASMIKCADGAWRTVAAGGRDLFRHGGPASAFLEARMRAKMRERLPLRYGQDPRTKAWEILPIGPEERAVFSRRNRQITEIAGPEATSARTKVIGAQLAEAKTPLPPSDVRRLWHQRALRGGIDPTALINAVLGTDPGATPTGPAPTPPTPDDLARLVFDPEHGLTANRKIIRRTDVLRAVLEALPDGISDLASAERLTDQVLTSPHVVRLPDTGPAHMSNTARYTTTDVLAVENQILSTVRRHRLAEHTQVPPTLAASVLERAEREQGFAFTTRQHQVLRRLVEEGHGVDTVIGVAGAGKTTIMSAARQVWQDQGLRVGGAATAAVAAANLHAEADIPSRTIASLLAGLDRGRGLGVDVLVLDEAAMIDDRSLSRILRAAEQEQVKVVGIGDPKQLRAVGIGGGFAAVHQQVQGLTLDENMRQRLQVDRLALRTWREGTDDARFSALAQWVGAGRVHAGENAQDTHMAALANWWRDTDQHTEALDVIDNVLLLAGRNNDVDELNLRARSLFRYEGRLRGSDVTFAMAGGTHLDLARGDVVRVRANDYRSRRDPERADVLNGYRAEVVKVRRRHGALIRWRRDGHTVQEWISPTQIAQGHLSHGYAMTVAAAQGLTAQRAHVYGLGVDGHTLYSAMSRAKLRTDLYLPLNVLESLEERAERGLARDERERARRATLAYAETINESDDTMVSDQSMRGPRSDSTTPAVVNDAPGPNSARLLEHRLALSEAVGALEQVELAADAVVRATDEVEALDERSRRGRLSLALEGTSRARERARVEQARHTLEETRRRLDLHREKVREHAARAGLKAEAHTLRDAHRAVTRDWDRLWERAARKDEAEAHTGLAGPSPKPAPRSSTPESTKHRAPAPEQPTPKLGGR